MKKWCLIFTLLFAFSANAQVIEADKLNLTDEQNKKLVELKENMHAEVQPIWEEIQGSRERIVEIEKKYFEEFWKMLDEKQKKEFLKIKEK